MDSMQIMIIISVVVIVGVIIFALIKILDAIKLLGENIDKVALDNNNVISNELRALGESITKITLDSKNSISNDLKVLSENIDKIQLANQKMMEDSTSKIDKLINTSFEQLNHIVLETKESLLKNSANLKLVLQDEMKLLNASITSSADEVKKDTKIFKVNFEKYHLNNKNQLENSFQNTVKLVNNLRLDNLINVANEIGKYKNGVVEDEHFLQEVGHCKIIKFTDKQTNEVTNVYYDENGEKSYTQTYLNDYLKYEMIYTNGLLSQGAEFNNLKQVIFAYQYDEVGEVSVKIEYEYDVNGNQIEKSRITY